ncbi:UPF0223 family protein [Fervidibacillus halotolerans]|uniref:UPF0223 protein OE105_03725 n=1 Tax=Fervidibacillus halotolerans TaxID=2980027 RepID=A0A9E8M0I0_9BACI|nr:UPF0223 family protein [Fervidibacillus halotolerans]WAA13243.1 UPF0223 family protein [Fervidibacillus halotolerans]
MKEYTYPISMDWTTQEIIDVVQFFESVEKVYEQGMERKRLMERYRKFKKVVPSIGEERKIFREFEEVSGLSAYHVVKKMKELKEGQMIRLSSNFD